jgi:tRNA U54 and U55 pseudouridine synthase Pus10
MINIHRLEEICLALELDLLHRPYFQNNRTTVNIDVQNVEMNIQNKKMLMSGRYEKTVGTQRHVLLLFDIKHCV